MKRSKLLLAEDEDALGVITAESLETRGFEVVHVRDGAEAWQSLKAAIFDLAILDVMMPRLDGFTLVKKIRLEYPHLPVLFLTGKTMTRDVVEGFESGGNDYQEAICHGGIGGKGKILIASQPFKTPGSFTQHPHWCIPVACAQTGTGIPGTYP